MPTTDLSIERIVARDGCDAATTPIRQIEGCLPVFPDGTWYLNGPGRFGRGGFRYAHWLDGDGLVRALTFSGGDVTFVSRFVRTRKFLSEERDGRALYRTFGSGFPGDRLNTWQTGLESNANVSVVSYADRLFALGEQGEPWEIDPTTLDTLGAFSASGAITAVTPFAAHAKVDAATGELFNFGVSYSPARPTLYVFRFDAKERQTFRARIPLHCSSTIHDFVLGPTTAAFYVTPYVLDMSRLQNGGAIIDALSWQPDLGSRLIVVSRETGELLSSIPVGRRYCLHTINSFARDGLLVIDVLEMSRPIYDTYLLSRLFERAIDATPVRFCIDIATGRLVSRQELRGTCAPEFPAIDPRDAARDYSTFWALDMSSAKCSGAKFFDRIVRCSWQADQPDSYQAPDGVFFGGEPLVIRDIAGATWVMCQLVDSREFKGGFAVFDAFHLQRGPVARLWLGTPTPMAFHGVFVARQRN